MPEPSMPAPPSVLIIAYAFPPSGGAGVQRLGKLAKYLPMHASAA